MQLASRKTIAESNAKNYQATKHAKVVRKWNVKKGVCELSQRSTGDWLAEFTSHDGEQYTVVLAESPKIAVRKLKVDTTPV